MVLFSLHLSLCTTAWVTFNGGLQPGLFRAATRSFENVSCLLTLASFPISVLSLSSIHILHIESLFRFSPYEFRIESIPKTPARASLVVRGPAFCIASKFFLAFRSYCDGGISWRRVSILRPSERMSCILPQDHGVLA